MQRTFTAHGEREAQRLWREGGKARALGMEEEEEKEKKSKVICFLRPLPPPSSSSTPPLSPSPSPSPPSRRNLWRSASEPSKRSSLAENPDASSLRKSRLPSRGEERGRENVDEKKKGKVEVEVDNTNKSS